MVPIRKLLLVDVFQPLSTARLVFCTLFSSIYIWKISEMESAWVFPRVNICFPFVSLCNFPCPEVTVCQAQKHYLYFPKN